MVLVSYKNIMRGFDSGISMSCVCPTQSEADHLFRRAIDIWHIEGFSQVSNNGREILYGPSGDRLSLRFRNISGMDHGSWKGFRGMYLFHPSFEQNQMTDTEQRLRSEMGHHNERYRKQWRA